MVVCEGRACEWVGGGWVVRRAVGSALTGAIGCSTCANRPAVRVALLVTRDHAAAPDVCTCVYVCVCVCVYVCTCVACLTGTHITLKVPGLDPDFVPPESPAAVVLAVDLEVNAAFGFTRSRLADRKKEFTPVSSVLKPAGSCSSSDDDRSAHFPSFFGGGFRTSLGGINL